MCSVRSEMCGVLLWISIGAFCINAQNSSFQKPVLGDTSVPLTFAALYSVGEVKGTIKNKAIFLPKPEYPFDAISEESEGKVRVKVTIGETGIVELARATEGPTALRNVSEDAARRSAFRPHRPGGSDAIKTDGELVYEFGIKPLRWLLMGYYLGRLPIISSLRYFPVAPMGKLLQPSWDQEQTLLLRLAALKKDEVDQKPFEMPAERPKLVQATIKGPDGSMRYSATLETERSKLRVPAQEQGEISKGLIESITQKRFSGHESDRWWFTLGLELSTAFETRDSVLNRRLKAERLRLLAKERPTTVAALNVEGLGKVISLLDANERNPLTDLKLYKAIVNFVVNG